MGRGVHDLAPLSTLMGFLKARYHCSGFQGDREVFLSPSLSHLQAHCRESSIKAFSLTFECVEIGHHLHVRACLRDIQEYEPEFIHKLN